MDDVPENGLIHQMKRIHGVIRISGANCRFQKSRLGLDLLSQDRPFLKIENVFVLRRIEIIREEDERDAREEESKLSLHGLDEPRYVAFMGANHLVLAGLPHGQR